MLTEIIKDMWLIHITNSKKKGEEIEKEKGKLKTKNLSKIIADEQELSVQSLGRVRAVQA